MNTIFYLGPLVLSKFQMILLICSYATLLFFSLFSVVLGSNRKKTDTRSRIADISSDGPVLTMAEEKKRQRFRIRRKPSDKLRKRLRQMDDELYNVGIEMPAKDFLVYWVGSMLLLALALLVANVNILITIPIVLAVAFFPALLVSSKKKKRRQIIEDQLIDCIQILSNALRAGHSFQQAMSNIASEMDGPVAEEFNRVFLETQHGMNLDDSLEAMCARVGSDDLTMMCTAVEIQRQVGGNLSQILMNVAGTIKARLRLKAEIKVKSASGRISGLIIGALPIVLFAMFMVINRGYMKFFLSGLPGFLCIGFCVVMECIGFLVINKIVSIKY